MAKKCKNICNKRAQELYCATHLTFTLEALLVRLLTEAWRWVIDSGKFVAVAFIDFRKAFDSVPHATLIMKLERHFGIKGLTLDWLKSYLTGRKQFTV